MWPRVVELMLGIWLTLTPFIYRLENPSPFQLEVVVGVLVIVLSCLSFWRPTAWAHVVTFIVALGLGLFAWTWFERPGPPLAQNDILVALLLASFAILPNEVFLPPRAWRDFVSRRDNQRSLG